MSYDAKPIYFHKPARSTFHIKAAIDSFLEFTWLPIHNEPEDLILYHYTSLEGLKGIINNRSIWATHTSTLNDPMELKYGKNLILEAINESTNGEKDDIIKQLLRHLSAFVNAFDTLFYQTYVACFCKSENLLSQWRGYSTQNGGYNLGISFQTNTKFYHTLDDPRKESHVILRKIIYDLDSQRKFISDYLSAIVASSKKAIKGFENNDGIPDGWTSIAAIEAVNILNDLMLSFKNPLFKEESEWRLIKGYRADINPELLKFRDIENALVPYIETFIVEETDGEPIFPLHSIRFGPMFDETRTKSSLELFVQKESVSKGKINIDTKNVKISGAGYYLRS